MAAGAVAVLAAALVAGLGFAPEAGASTVAPARTAMPTHATSARADSRPNEEYWVDWGDYNTEEECETAGEVILASNPDAIEFECEGVWDGPKGQEKWVYNLRVLMNEGTCIVRLISGRTDGRLAVPAC